MGSCQASSLQNKMGFIKQFLVVSILAGISSYVYQQLTTPPSVPQEWIQEKWWGKGKPKDDVTTIKKFTINVEETVLDDLKERLNRTRFVEPLPGAKFGNGFNGDQLKKVVDYWLNKYNWRAQEKQLNKYDQFLTQIEGIDVHFIHVKANKKAKKVLPLLMVHGWPGSVVEYYKTIEKLSTVENDIGFELIVPSIPGYGFSEIPHRNNFLVPDAARILAKLMERLGFRQFYYHGGDWGSIIGLCMSLMYPNKILGYHTTMAIVNRQHPLTLAKTIVGSYFPALVFDNPKEDHELLYPISETLKAALRESGYMHIQATKPDTIGASLVDSPAGLAAYILEKFSTWVNEKYIERPDGGLLEKFTMDELLNNVMLYWVTGTGASSVRLYKSIPLCLFGELGKIPLTEEVLTGVSLFPNEIKFGVSPRALVKDHYKGLIYYSNPPRGGHFAAFEEPDLMAKEIRAFVSECIRVRSQPTSA